MPLPSPLLTTLLILQILIPPSSTATPTVHGWRWYRPFPFDSSPPYGFRMTCTQTQTFHATHYKLSDIRASASMGADPWTHALEFFDEHRYPGSWDGANPKEEDRDILMMEFADVPFLVREWIIEQRARSLVTAGLYGIFTKPAIWGATHPEDRGEQKDGNVRPDVARSQVMFFAPGALYEILPLWVAAESQCRDTLRDLTRYNPDAHDGGVVAWPVRVGPREVENSGKKGGRDEIEFTIEAMVLEETEHGKMHRQTWERVWAVAKKQERRARKEGGGRWREKDEL